MEDEKKKKMATYHKKWYKDNREKILAQHKLWRETNPEYDKNYYQLNKTKRRHQMKKYNQKNAGKVNSLVAKRKSRKLQATPPWMTKADFVAIEEWYKIAQDLQWLSEEKLHVDHIIPLQGKDVCGLHIAANLQILPASENSKKKNKLCL